MMNIPNLMTFFRLIVALVIAWPFFLMNEASAALLVFFLFTIASITDFLDGYIARKYNQTSELGRMLDPIADKVIVLMTLAVVMAVLGLRAAIVIPASMIFFREVLVSGMREYLGDRAKALKVTKLAKWKTFAQMTAIAALLLAIALQSGALESLGVILLWIAAILTFITGADYAQKAVSLLED